mmetsp:Transcript_61536/g.169101  ORF Transcript_61536/g.169101 Transcript_61536/m.169101 type:complete len:85 (-) Transcript_61536:2740-2994(-)
MGLIQKKKKKPSEKAAEAEVAAAALRTTAAMPVAVVVCGTVLRRFLWAAKSERRTCPCMRLGPTPAAGMGGASRVLFAKVVWAV